MLPGFWLDDPLAFPGFLRIGLGLVAGDSLGLSLGHRFHLTSCSFLLVGNYALHTYTSNTPPCYVSVGDHGIHAIQTMFYASSLSSSQFLDIFQGILHPFFGPGVRSTPEFFLSTWIFSQACFFLSLIVHHFEPAPMHQPSWSAF